MANPTLSSIQIISICLFVLIALFEVLFPFRRYLGRLRHFGKNVAFSIFNAVITGLSTAALNLWVFLWIDAHHIGLLNQIELPFWLSALMASLLFDCWIYTWHRLNHVIPFLWRFHQVHHSDLEMDVSTAFRFHPGEILLSSLANIGIFVAFGITVELLVIYKIVFNINVLLHHSNIAVPEKGDRLLRSVLVSPNMHRVHHSRKLRETNSNYASVLTIWDRIFGSYRRSDPSKIVFGLEYDREPMEQRLTALLLRPFRPRFRNPRAQRPEALSNPSPKP